MGMSLDIHNVKSIEFDKVYDRGRYSSRTITITTESGEQVELNLYADSESPESAESLKLKI